MSYLTTDQAAQKSPKGFYNEQSEFDNVSKFLASLLRKKILQLNVSLTWLGGAYWLQAKEHLWMTWNDEYVLSQINDRYKQLISQKNNSNPQGWEEIDHQPVEVYTYSTLVTACEKTTMWHVALDVLCLALRQVPCLGSMECTGYLKMM